MSGLLVPEWVALGALAVALLQWILASQRDLGAPTVALAGAAVLLAPAGGTPLLAVLLGATALSAAFAWIRAGRHGVGRPAITGAVLAVVTLAATVRWWFPLLAPGAPVERVLGVAVVPCALAGVLGLLLAMEQPGPRRVRPRWRRVVVPIEEGE